MGVMSSGQITITDLNDAPVLNAFITASQPISQVYNSTAQTWAPSYASTAQALTLNLTKAGSATSILAGVSGNVTWTRRDGATTTTISSTTTTETQYLSGTKNSVLNTKVNVPIAAGTSRVTASGTWIDASGVEVPWSATIDLTVLQTAKAAILATAYAPNGDTFRNSTPASLTVNGDLYKDGGLSGGNKRIKWFKADTSVTGTGSPGYDADGGLGWFLCQTTTPNFAASIAPTTDTTAQGVLTVTAAGVINAQSIKVVIEDRVAGTSGTKATAFAALRDLDDPVMTVVESSAGNIMKNGAGSTTLTARLFRAGEEIDTGGTGYTYKWYNRDQNGTLNPNFGGSGVAFKTGKTLAVTASMIAVKGTFICEVS